MNKNLELYRDELEMQGTNFFILDTKGKGSAYGDVDFEAYCWDIDHYNQVKDGDLFIYRRQQKASEIKGQFYFFGAGKISKIQSIEGKRVKGIISKAFIFDEPLLQEELEDFKWEFRNRGKNWEHFFNQYGMNKITKNDFIHLLSFKPGVLQEPKEISSGMDEEVKFYQRQEGGNYRVEDQEGSSKTRGAAQKVFANQVKLEYGFQCAVTGIKTKELLVASHIVPWSEDKDNRLNPRNGICLSPLIDKAFDKGFISFTDDLKLIVSDSAKTDAALYESLRPYEGKRLNVRKEFEPDRDFLKWHRTHLLLKYNDGVNKILSKGSFD